jgi:hypothetical protein
MREPNSTASGRSGRSGGDSAVATIQISPRSASTTDPRVTMRRGSA